MLMQPTRRRFLTVFPLAGAAGLLPDSRSLAVEEPPEATTIRINKSPSICVTPQHITRELLHAEGFTDVQYVQSQHNSFQLVLANGSFDFGLDFAPKNVVAIDKGAAITILAGVHVGCFELFAAEGIRGVADLRSKSIGVAALGSPQHMFLTPIAAHVGIDPSKDVNWVVNPSVEPMQLFIDGKIDAFLGLPPEPQELRAKKIGHVIVNSAVDRPWSQYFCCMLAGNREFVSRYPIATKRVARAILKAADLCASDPARAARQLVDEGFTQRHDYALQTLSELPYDKWREYDAEDTVRFCALRLREAASSNRAPRRSLPMAQIGAF
jgi:NitT/TauT family transport system substrate-binding protein